MMTHAIPRRRPNAATGLAVLAISLANLATPSSRVEAATASPQTASAGAELIIHGGPILTMDGDRPTYAEAVVVNDGRITFVGRDADAMKQRSRTTVVRDLAGRTMLPGFVDGHSHFMMAVQMARQVNVANPPVGPCTDIPSVIAALRAFQAEKKIPEGEWIVGWGYDGTGLEEKRNITRADLDAAFPNNKVMLIHVSAHGAVLNSRALEWAGVTADTPTPAGGVIARMPDGREPAGLLMESGYLPVFEKFPQPSEAEMLELLAPAQMAYASNGYTLANEGFTRVRDIRLLQKGAAEGRLFVDVVALPGFPETREWLDNPEFPFGEYHGRLKLQGIKITQDGSPQGKTAYVTDPYRTGGPAGQADWRGETSMPYEQFAAIVKMASAKGLQIYIHANGDATIDEAIKAVEAAGITARDDRRTIVIHSQFQRPDQLPKYKALGISPSYFTNHTFFWGDVHRANIGEQEAAFISPMKAATNLGIVVSNHSDFNVTPLDPMFILWTSMARTTRSGFVLGPDQRVDAYTGLKALTTGPAWQYREENVRGRIKPGFKADFVILSADPLKTSVDQIRGIKVVETIKEGRTIYPARAEGAMAQVTGTVAYRERIALPPTAVIKVQLVDVSRADAPAIVLGEQVIEAGGRQVPFDFAIAYDAGRIETNHSYAVQARIEDDGRLRFISDQHYAVVTRGAPMRVDLVLKSVERK